MTYSCPCKNTNANMSETHCGQYGQIHVAKLENYWVRSSGRRAGVCDGRGEAGSGPRGDQGRAECGAPTFNITPPQMEFAPKNNLPITIYTLPNLKYTLLNPKYTIPKNGIRDACSIADIFNG